MIRNTIKTFLSLIALGTALPFMLGFFNDVHPLFDSFSHFRVHLLLILLPTMLLLAFFHKTRNTLIYLFLVLLGSFYLYGINQPFVAQEINKNKTHTLKHIQFNLNFRNQKMNSVISYLKKSNADVVTLQEVTTSHQDALSQALSSTYPYQNYCKFYPVVGAVAILSKYPFNKKNTACLEKRGLVWSQILVKDQAINIIAIHTLWPYPYGQPKQIQDIKPIFQQMKTPTLIAGDFNAASWSHTVKEIEKASHTKAVEGMRWSINLENQVPLIPNFKLAIDHVLLSKEFQVEEIFVEKSLGSDHLPVVSSIRY